MIKLHNYEEYCQAFAGSEDERHLAGLLFFLRTYILNIQKMDAQGLGYITMDDLLDCSREELERPADYLSGPAANVDKVFRHIVENLRTNILRENVLMPIYKAREFNSTSIGWLSKRPGRNVREKLSGSRSVMAVRRRMSFDTGENRLLKELSKRLEDYLFLKGKMLPVRYQDMEERVLYESLHRFRFLPEADEIKPWENTPPNNTLLSDRSYSVIWRSWNELNNISSRIMADQEHLSQRLANLFALMLIRVLSRTCRFPQMPLFYYYRTGKLAESQEQDIYNDLDLQLPFATIQAMGQDEKILDIKLLTDKPGIRVTYAKRQVELVFAALQCIVFVNNKQAVKMELAADELGKTIECIADMILQEDYQAEEKQQKKTLFTGPHACMDLFQLRPAIRQLGVESQYRGMLLCQMAEIGQEKYLLDCSSSRAMLYPDAVRVQQYTVKGLVGSENNESMRYLNCILGSLHRQMKANNLTFLYPDSCDEFQMVDLKRTVRRYYRSFEALPRSLGAIFTFMKDKLFLTDFNSGDVVLVLDRVKEGTSITMVRSIPDDIIKKQAPAMKGIAWEHHPSAIYYDERPGKDIILDSISREELLREGESQFYWSHDKGWCHMQDILAKEHQQVNVQKSLQEYRDSHGALLGNKRIWLIRLDEVGSSKGNNIYQQIDYTGRSILEGIEYYYQQKKKTKQPLWRDCLPDLAIRRLYGRLDLVKDRTFAYGGLQSMNIPVASSFALPRGQAEYHFQLLMGDNTGKIPYQAVVRHKKFPLAYDVECKLDMSYNYGADNPYTLKFMPLDKAWDGFKEVEVSWEPLQEYPVKGEQYPAYPEDDGWQGLLDFWGNNGWIGDLSQTVYSNVEKLTYQWSNWDSEYRKKRSNFILFCLHTIYSNGRYVGMDDCPEHFRATMKEALEELLDFYDMYCNDDKDGYHIFKMLCIAGRDVEENFVYTVRDYIRQFAEENRDVRDEVGFMLGDYSLPRQKDIFYELEFLAEEKVIPLLARAVWRNPDFIFNFPVDQTQKYFGFAVELLRVSSNYIKVTAIEYIMAVFRLRKLGSKEINEFLSLNNPLMQELREIVEKIIAERKLDLSKSRLELAVHQGMEYEKYKIPDLLYALLVYINDEAGDGDIRITKIKVE